MAETLTPTPPADPSRSPAPAEAAPAGGGFFGTLSDLYLSPRQAFARIVARPTFLLPLAGYLVLVLGFTGIWLSKVDAREFVRTQLQESGRWDKIPAESREAVLDRAPAQMKMFGWISPLVITPVMLVVVALALMAIFNFFYAGDVGFKRAFSIVTWTFFAVGLVTTVLMLVVFSIKGDWNINPQEALQANLGLLVEKATTAKPLWALLTSIDLFALWLVFLLASGFGVASRKSTGAAFWGIAVPWLVIVLVKVGWAAL